MKYKQSTFLFFSVFILHLYFYLGSSIKAYFYWTSRIWSINRQPSKFTSAVSNCQGFSKANSVFIVITLAKILPRWLFPSKIYIQFTIFNTYFSTKLFYTNKRYHLHVLEKCLYVLQEVRPTIYFQLLIHPPSLMFLNSFFHITFSRSTTGLPFEWDLSL